MAALESGALPRGFEIRDAALPVHQGCRRVAARRPPAGERGRAGLGLRAGGVRIPIGARVRFVASYGQRCGDSSRALRRGSRRWMDRHHQPEPAVRTAAARRGEADADARSGEQAAASVSAASGPAFRDDHGHRRHGASWRRRHRFRSRRRPLSRQALRAAMATAYGARGPGGGGCGAGTSFPRPSRRRSAASDGAANRAQPRRRALRRARRDRGRVRCCTGSVTTSTA